MKIKIAFISKKMDYGGIEKAALDILKQLNPRLFEVDYYYRRRPHEAVGELMEQIPSWVHKTEIEIPKLDNYKDYFPSFYSRCLFILNYFKSFLRRKSDNATQYSCQAKLAVKKETLYDIAIAFDGPTAYGVFYTIDAIRAKRKILWIHGDIEKEGATTSLIRKYYSVYDYIITVSEEAKDIFVRRFPELKDRLRVVYNYVDFKKIRARSIEENVDLESIYGNYSGLKLCTVGRLGEDKGMPLIAECSKLLKEKRVDFRWIICGEGPVRSYLEQYIIDNNLCDNLFLVGNQNNPYPFMKKCDIYVQPSVQEGFCTTTIEAKVLAKPVITTNVCGMAEQFQNGINGIVLDKRTPEEMCATIERLNNDSILRESLTEKLLEFQWDKQTDFGRLILQLGGEYV